MKRFIKILCVALLSLVGLWLLAGAVLSAYFYLATPESPVVDDGDLRIAEVEVPDEENAYAAFLSVTNLLDCSSEDKSVLGLLHVLRWTIQAVQLLAEGWHA